MQFLLSLNDICNLLSITAIVVLCIFLLGIFAGRRKEYKEFIFVFFAIFSLSLSTYVILSTNFKNLLIPNKFLLNNLYPCIRTTLAFIMSFSAYFFMSILYNYKIHLRDIKKCSPFYILYIIAFILTLSTFITGHELYYKYLYKLVLLLVMGFTVVPWIIFTIWFFREKKFKELSTAFIFAGFLLIAFHFNLEQILGIFKIKYLLRNNFLPISVSTIILSFSFIFKFNKEHWNVIKANAELENKIEIMCQKANLTPREKEVVSLLTKGLPDKEIADKLKIKTNTLYTHKNNIYKKTKAANKIHLIEIINETIIN